MKSIVILLTIITCIAFAQPAQVTSENSSGGRWQIPFASIGNTITLSIQNNSGIEAKDVSVEFENVPLSPSAPSSTWLKFKSTSFVIKSIPANSSGDAEFIFSIDRKAPVGKDTTLTARISMSDGQSWTKEIKVTVAAPKEYKLYENFPNPFNPSTKIAFELPKASHVKLVIYDITGREVAQVGDADYPAGYNELTWNGLNKNGNMVSSGAYFYRINTDSWSKVKKMMVLK
jgi:hypothetical protein